MPLAVGFGAKVADDILEAAECCGAISKGREIFYSWQRFASACIRNRGHYISRVRKLTNSLDL